MADWQEGMDYLMREGARRRGVTEQAAQSREAIWQQFYDEARNERGYDETRAREYADMMAARQERLGITEPTQWTEDSGFQIGIPLPFGVGERGGPTSAAAMAGPPGMGGPPTMATPPNVPGTAFRAGGGQALPGSQFSYSSPTPPVLSGEFGMEDPDPLAGGTKPGGVVETGGGGGVFPAIGRFITDNPELVTGVLAAGTNIYGAAQEGKARSEELEEQRRQHEEEMKERRKQREDERINMILRAISSTI